MNKFFNYNIITNILLIITLILVINNKFKERRSFTEGYIYISKEYEKSYKAYKELDSLHMFYLDSLLKVSNLDKKKKEFFISSRNTFNNIHNIAFSNDYEIFPDSILNQK